MLESNRITGPVGHAIRTMRSAERDEQDDAIRRMITGVEPVGRGVRPQVFGPNRERLRDVSIAGLISLFQGYEAAGHAFTHEANTPRACKAAERVLDEAAGVHHFAMEDVIQELSGRKPGDNWEAFYQRETLLHWHIDREDWAEAQVLLDAAAKTAEAA